ncbi:hypothetical protein RM844_28415 [Streptomyces sp. DSM 44915]|uniref:Uncharacterized protein n=1 Tax=Streptomyces chisholmiae TaxID=3075540 RepID=A0ABU2JZK3_9ACTN|nr:hypothetical protein [Streptomyces sp. DSM 44915]MDT0270201.1 hypothetical protein [Streptomyces sp. DSM 44915]
MDATDPRPVSDPHLVTARARLVAACAAGAGQLGGAEARAAYRAWLPEVPVARCPASGRLVTWPLDQVDLDGPWWNVDAPVRRLPAEPPAAWLAMTGALRLDRSALAVAPFRARPGPGVPYVLPRLLGLPGVRAVLGQLAVGPHTAWVTSYFGSVPPGTELADLWGQDSYPVWRHGRWQGWAAAGFRAEDNDHDLLPWLRRGKLWWIAPGDRSWTPRQGLDCPFLGLPGTRENQVVRRGEVCHPPR